MISFLKLIRYKNLFMVLLTMILTKYSLIESFISTSFLSNLEFVLLCISVLCITAGGYIVNDIYDVEADRINKPTKVFVGNSISLKNAWRAYFILTFFGLALGVNLSFEKELNETCFIFFGTSLFLYLYSKSLKKLSLIGNLNVSILVALTILIVLIFEYPKALNSMQWSEFIYGELIIYGYVIFSFLTTLIREIVKDIEDVNGDLKINAKTLPIVIGRKRANRVVIGFSILLLLFLIVIIREYLLEYPLFLGYSIVFLLVPICYFIYKLYSAESKKKYSFLSKFMKIIMFFGILSMVLFKFI